MTEKETIEYLEQHGYIADEVKDMAIKALKRQSIQKQLLVKSITDRLETNSFWTEPTYDVDGYSNDDEMEVVRLDKAIEIVKEELETYGNADGWVPCGKKLPEMDECCEWQCVEYEVTIDNGERIYTSHATFDHSNKKWLVGKSRKVLAWRILAEPYRPGKE